MLIFLAHKLFSIRRSVASTTLCTFNTGSSPSSESRITARARAPDAADAPLAQRTPVHQDRVRRLRCDEARGHPDLSHRPVHLCAQRVPGHVSADTQHRPCPTPIALLLPTKTLWCLSGSWYIISAEFCTPSIKASSPSWASPGGSKR